MTNMAALSLPFGLRRRGAALASVLIAVAVGLAIAAPAGAASRQVSSSRPLVVLLHTHIARTRPGADTGRRIEAVSAKRPLTRSRTVLPVLGRATTPTGGSWLQVRLPGRPNSHRGWISTKGTRLSSTEWHLLVRLSSRTVTVYRAGRVSRRFRAVVGKPSTPTPRGQFFVEESLALSSYDAGGPFALATSARSNILHEFEGGPGQIGIHGTNNLSGALGTAVSHGCIRLSTHAVTWLARRIGAGVPLTIIA